MAPLVIELRRPARPSRAGGRRRGICGIVCCIAMAALAFHAAQSAEPPSTPRDPRRAAAGNSKVDHAVVPAGGAVEHANCWQCRKAACPQCRLRPEQQQGHAPCQHGLCPAHCPVRPDVFGFYGTQWRRWPGSGVVQASAVEASTPERPARAVVPGPAEESIQPLPGAEALTVPAKPRAVPGLERGPAAFGRGETETLPAPAKNGPALKPAQPADRPAIKPGARPDGANPPPAKPSVDENLFNFDDGSRSVPWRSFTAAARRQPAGRP